MSCSCGLMVRICAQFGTNGERGYFIFKCDVDHATGTKYISNYIFLFSFLLPVFSMFILLNSFAHSPCIDINCSSRFFFVSLQLIAVTAAQYLNSSICNALDRGDPERTAKGWVFEEFPLVTLLKAILMMLANVRTYSAMQLHSRKSQDMDGAPPH